MQILCKKEEIIYPASSAHPKLFRLSETDQLRVVAPMLYFYKQGPASSEAMKRSLSKTLTFFYPLAGRLEERSTEEIAKTCPENSGGGDEVVESKECEGTSGNAKGGTGGTCRVAIGGRMDVRCLDEGALFCEAWTDACLDAYAPDFPPHPHFVLLIVPDHHDFLLRVQITHFACGGICLCVQAHHCLVDGVSNAHFMKCWVEITNGEESPTICPYMSHPPLEVMYKPAKPCMHDYSSYYQPLPSNDSQELSKKIFHFTPKFIETLKRETSDESCKYSSFECITAYMWKSLTLARGIASNEEVCLYYPVNGRGMLEPPLPPSYLGNVIFRTHASVKVSDLVGKPLSHITHILREATCKVTDAHIRSVIDWSTKRTLPMSASIISSPHIFFNSWASFPLLDFNFGWGNPLCCRVNPCIPFEFVLLLPSPLGRGHTEVLVALNKEHMNKLESLMPQVPLY